MIKQLFRREPFTDAAVGAVILVGLYLTSLYSYLLFHSLAELFSITIGCCIFMITWNSRRFLDNNYILFIGIAYLFVGMIDLIHMLAYKGMNVFIGYDANLPTQLWIAARYLQSISLLIAPLFMKRQANVYGVLFGYIVVTSLLFWSIFYAHIFPVSYVEGVGLTGFKIASELIISLILLASVILIYLRRAAFDENVLHLLMVSILLTIGAEFAFIFYNGVYDPANLMGHLLKIVAFYLIYKAVVETGLARPFDLLFRDLKHLGTHDVLTALYNRAYFEEELARLEFSRRFPVSIVVADLDSLKEINDSQGHAAGDEMLKQVGKILKDVFRTEDVVARIGGDEFAVILPNTGKAAVEAAVARVRARIVEEKEARQGFAPNLSIGMSTADSSDPLDKAFKEADQRMYQEKTTKSTGMV